jgi:diguanylate cyclase (GGDEF)-like protein
MGAGRITQAINQGERHGSKVAILFIDIDNFKSVNDTLGHAAGDKLLRETAERIVSSVRHADIVSRHGGDEFVLGLTDLTDGAAAGEIAETILAELNRPILLDGHEISTSGSIGIAIYPDDATVYDELVSLADIAMYQAKESGRNLACFYRADMNQASQESRRLVPELRQSLARGEFSLRYQPVYELKGQTLVGVEALVRWQHPKHGELSPTMFIPAAEKSGLIVDLGEWVLREALAQMARWRAQGHLGLTVAVNLSPVQFRRGNVETMVETLLAESGVPAHCLELEITETALLKDAEQFLHALKRLKSLGVTVAIDDFGTGYSNFAYLPRLKVDKLKIDRSFISKLLETDEDRSIVTAIIQVAHAYNLKTTAEGIEHQAAIAPLLSIGCDLGQGFHFAKPLESGEIDLILSAGL